MIAPLRRLRAWGAGLSSRARVKHVLLVSVSVFLVVNLLQRYFENTSAARDFEDLEFSRIQAALRSDLATNRRSYAPDYRLPIVVDISPIPFDRTQPTDRAMLEQLVDALEEMNPRAIGIDIDFSPDDNGRFITPGDPRLMLKWASLKNVRVGVYRTIGESSDRWLGHPEFKPLAAGMLLPTDPSGYAYHFSWLVSSVANQATQGCLPTRIPTSAFEATEPAECLLQLPEALYDVIHPGYRARLLEDAQRRGHITGDKILASMYPIDYSYRDQIRVIPYSTTADLEQWRHDVDRGTVIIGDARDAADSLVIPGQLEPVPGVLVHAEAFATLSRDVLVYIDRKASAILEVLLWSAVVLTMCLVFAAGGLRGVSESFLEALASLAAALVVVLISIGYIGITHLFWPDFLLVAVGFVLHPYVRFLLGRLRQVAGALRNRTAGA